MQRMMALPAPTGSGAAAPQPDATIASPAKRDLRIAVTGLAAALAALPLPAHASSPEVAAALAVGAIALALGQRWALGVVVIAEVLLMAALWPIAFLHYPPSVPAQIAVAIAFAGALPGLLALGRAAPSLLDLVGVRGSARIDRVARAAMLVGSLVVIAWPAL
jgi:hypothetical protein